MANYQQLKAAIDQVIKANGQEEITGPVLNDALTAIINSIGAGYQFMGVAIPTTNPGTPDQRVFYCASKAGTYFNFGGIILHEGIAFLKWNGSWTVESLELASAEQLQSNWTQTDVNAPDYIKNKPIIPPSAIVDPVPTKDSMNGVASGGVFDALQDLNEIAASFSEDGKVYFDFYAGDIFYIEQDDVRKYRVAYFDGTADEEHPVTIDGTRFYFADNAADAILMSLRIKTVSTVKQELTTTQKSTARENIAAVAYEKQELTSAQQVQLQNNMMGKEYAPADFSGLGKKVFAKNVQSVGGVNKNIMTQAFFEDAQGNSLTNTVFVIQYDYELGENITIPADCVLEFEGGSISAGNGENCDTITCTDTAIEANGKVFDAVNITGTIKNYELYLSWWHKGELDEDCSFGIRNLCNISSWTWGGNNHCIVLISGRIKVDPDVFVVNNANVEGNYCILSSTTSGEGVGITTEGTHGSNIGMYIRNIYILDTIGNFNVGIHKKSEHNLENITVQYCTIGCLIYNGNNYLSDIIGCNFNYNSLFGIKIDDSGAATSAGLKILRSYCRFNGVAGLYLIGGSPYITIDKSDFESNGNLGETIKAGVGIACRVAPSFLTISNCYFELQGTVNGMGILLFGAYSELTDLVDVKQTFIDAEVPDYSGDIFTSWTSRVIVDKCVFSSCQGVYISETGDYETTISNIKFSGNQYAVSPLYINFNLRQLRQRIEISNVAGANNNGIAKTPITITGFSLTSQLMESFCNQIFYNGNPISYFYGDVISVLNTITDNSKKLVPAVGANLKETYIETFRVYNNLNNQQRVSTFEKYMIFQAASDSTLVGFTDSAGNTPAVAAGKYLIIPWAVQSYLVYRLTSGAVGTTFCDDFGVFRLPANIDTSNVLIALNYYIKQLPCYLLSESEYIELFNAFRLKISNHSVEVENGEQSRIIPLGTNGIEVFKQNANKYYDGFDVVGKRRGTTSERPTFTSTQKANNIGYSYFDETLGKPIYLTANGWVDATGASIS